MKKWLLLGVMVALMPAVYADQAGDIAKVKKSIADNFDGATPESVKPSPMPGVYEAVFDTNVVYFSGNGEYMLAGNMIDAKTKQDLTTKKREQLVLQAVDEEPEDHMIVMKPKDAKRVLTVFTDVDCPYCAKFHQEVPALNKAGVEVRYLFYPRAGVNSDAYKKSVSVWCADDRIDAIGKAKAGKDIPAKTCDNPVKEHMALAERVGLRGTPMIITDEGEILPGFVPTKPLLKKLGL